MHIFSDLLVPNALPDMLNSELNAMTKPRVRRSMYPTFNIEAGGQVLRANVTGGTGGVLPNVCVALVDARFMGWLIGADHGSAVSDSGPLLPSQELLSQLRGQLVEAGMPFPLLRVYWYTDKQPPQLVDHLVVRMVADTNQESGFGIVRAMSDDLLKLAQAHTAGHVLLASDDERLWAAVDQAQLHGVCLHMLCDDRVGNYARLQQDDPTWARLLSQADRRVVWAAGSTGPCIPVMRASAASGSVADGALHQQSHCATDARVDAAANILAHIEHWWSEEPEEQRVALRNELRMSRNIPQVLDRQLLLRLSRELGRPLSWPDKKVMREGLRRIVHVDVPDPVRSAEHVVAVVAPGPEA